MRFHQIVQVVFMALLLCVGGCGGNGSSSHATQGPGTAGQSVGYDDGAASADHQGSPGVEFDAIISASNQTNFATNLSGARNIVAADVDGDGDLDALGTGEGADDVRWWNNTAGDGSTWTEVIIDGSLDGANGLDVADIDGDGDLDVAATGEEADDVVWYENTAGDGSAWTKHNVDTNYDGANDVWCADVDGDGDVDILGTAVEADDVVWFENTAGDGSAWTKRTIDSSFGTPREVYSADIDGDGDLDVVTTGNGSDGTTWFENTVGDGSSWTPRVILSTATLASSAADMDGDGDVDVLIALYSADDVVWMENAAGDGTSWTQRNIDTNFDDPRCIVAADMDGDGDPDVLAAGWAGTDFAWWENTDGNAGAWSKHLIDSNIGAGTGCTAADLDGDGDLDAMACGSGTFSWWKNTTERPAIGTAFVQHTITGSAPSDPYDFTLSDLDGDGDLDVLSCGLSADQWQWFENTDGIGGSWTGRNTVSTEDGPFSIVAGDIDGDGDADVVVANRDANTINWNENTAGDGSAWGSAVQISTSSFPRDIELFDVDRDGDLDVIGACGVAIIWWENTAGDGSAWTSHSAYSVSNSTTYGIAAGDINGDGFLDLVGAYSAGSAEPCLVCLISDGTPADGGWTTRVVDSVQEHVAAVAVADVDGDGDLDVLSAKDTENRVSWWENTAGDGSAWTEHVVDSAFADARSVKAADLDQDGDMDVLAAGQTSGDTVWWENDNGSGTAWTEHIVFNLSTGNAFRVLAEDMDKDGDLDVAICAPVSQDLLWKEVNRSPVFIRNAGLAVNENATGNAIDDADLKFFDADSSTTPVDVKYTLQSLPARGTLYINGNPADLSTNKTFTQADLNAGNVFSYSHGGIPNTTDSFTFSVADDRSLAASSNPYTFDITVTLVDDAPVFAALGGTVSYTPGGPAFALDADATVSDEELDALNGAAGNYDGGVLTLVRNGGADTSDMFSFPATSTNLTYGSSTIQRTSNGKVIAAIVKGGGQLQVTFDDASGEIPTTAYAVEVLRAIRFFNAADAGALQINYTFDDGTASVANATGSVTVNSASTPPTVNDPIDDVSVVENAADSVIDLLSAFTDAEQSDDSLVYSVTGNTNPSLFNSVSINQIANTLTLSYVNGAFGVATLTVRATDYTGNWVEDAFLVTVANVNNAPGFVVGPGQVGIEDSGAHSIPGWATGITAGAPNESGQALTFHLLADPTDYFSVQPAVNAAGTLTYTLAPDAYGLALVSIYLTDDGGTDYGGEDTSDEYQFEISINAVNDPPSFTPGSNQTVGEDAGAQSVAGWATSLSKGPANESGQTLTFSLVNTNNGLFSAQPAVASNGTLTFTPAANANGAATVTVSLTDSGGTALGGDNSADPEVFTITVNPVNDPPSFVKGGNQEVDEDSGAHSVPGWATGISPGPADEAGQSVSFQVMNNNNSLFSVQPAVASNGTLSFTVADDHTGIAVVDVVAVDNGGGDDTSAPQEFIIAVGMDNDDPVFFSNNTLQVIRGSTGNFIHNGLLRFVDIDSDDDEIVYTLATLPLHGSLRIHGSPATLGDNDEFTQAELNAGNVVRYDHNGDEAASDTFSFNVEDTVGGEASGNPYAFSINVALIHADAGENILAAQPGAHQLDGSGSVLSTGATVSWSYDSGPDPVSLTNANTLTPGFVAHFHGDYVFTLTLSLNGFSDSQDSVTVTVADVAPVAVPTPQATTLHLFDAFDQPSALTLSGLGSYDPNEPGEDEAIDEYEWSLDAAHSPADADINELLDNRFAAEPVFMPLVDSEPTPGLYTLQLRVSSGIGAMSDPVSVSILVFYADLTDLANSIVPPAAIAGPDRTVFLDGGSVDLTLFGHDSVDPDSGASGIDNPLTADFDAEWDLLEQPDGSDFEFTGQQNDFDADITLEAPGRYVFGLTVTDNNDDGIVSLQDTVEIFVYDENNWPPQAVVTVSPGVQANVGQTFTLDGSGSVDPEGGPLFYLWQQTAGPALTLTPSATADTLTLTPGVAGTYRFVLRLGDDQGQFGVSTVTLQVTNPSTTAPVARARANGQAGLLLITAPTGAEVALGATPAEVTLGGNLSTGVNGTSGAGLSYQWTQLGGPTLAIPGATSATAVVTPYLSRTYIFQLAVTDVATGLTDTDLVFVVVSTSVNGVPTAGVFGANSAFFVNSPSVALDLSASSDPDNADLTYYLIQKDGPAIQFVIEDGILTFLPNGPVEEDSGERETFLEGNYLFCLWVDDGQDMSAPLEFEIAIQEAPAVFSGGGGGGGGGAVDLLLLLLIAAFGAGKLGRARESVDSLRG